jgi:hypothetical protein
MLTRTDKIDPKDYPFKAYADAQKHLDTPELRHLIKPIQHVIDKDFAGKEHLFCDPSQRDAQGKFRIPKALQKAKEKGFNTVMEMLDADKKAEEDAKKAAEEAKVQETADLKKQVSDLTALVQQLLAANAKK